MRHVLCGIGRRTNRGAGLGQNNNPRSNHKGAKMESSFNVADRAREHFIRKYGSSRQAAHAYGLSESYISQIVTGKKNVPRYVLADMGLSFADLQKLSGS
jgi:hypothetical protein